MQTDRQGLAVTGGAEALDAYERALDHLVRFQIEVVDETLASIDADPAFVMGQVLSIYLSLLSTDGADVARARDTLDALRRAVDGRDLLPREQAHLATAARWVGGDLIGAGRMLDDIAVEHPQDLLALAIGHQVDFFTGNASNLRDRIGRALAAWHPDDPRFGFVVGMHAFGLEESNLYGLSEAAGLRALDAHPEDVWAVHAVVHTYEMQGRVPAGVRFMREREGDWATGNFLNVHNWWHYALYLLEADDVAGALEVYDRGVRNEGSADVALQLLDATALLWRLHLEGLPVGDRWRPLADAWAQVLVPGYYPFNDMHAVMAFIGAGDLASARDLVRTLEQLVEHDDASSTGALLTASVGLAVCRAFACFGEGDYPGVLAQLWPVRPRVHDFGGSHAQRDVVERTLLEAAIRAGRADLASALVSERLGVRERSAYAWAKRGQLLVVTGDPSGASSSAARAAELAAVARDAVA